MATELAPILTDKAGGNPMNRGLTRRQTHRLDTYLTTPPEENEENMNTTNKNIIDWISEDPKDRFYQLVRIAIEESENRYGMPLFVNVEQKNTMLWAHLRTLASRGGFVYDITDLVGSNGPPLSYILETEIFPLLKSFAQKQNKGNGNDNSSGHIFN